MMDLNKDGVLDKFEFILAQRSLGYVCYVIDCCVLHLNAFVGEDR